MSSLTSNLYRSTLSALIFLYYNLSFIHSQVFLYHIGQGDGCRGTSDVQQLQKTVGFDFNPLFIANGITQVDTPFDGEFIYRFTMCGALNNSVDFSCPDSRNWNIERNYNNKTCQSGITAWTDDVNPHDINITYWALTDSNNIDDATVIGAAIKIEDTGERALACPSSVATVTFELVCDPTRDEPMSAGVSEDIDACTWDFFVHTKWACLSWWNMTQEPSEHPRKIGAGVDCKGYGDVTDIGGGVRVEYDLSSLHRPDGDLVYDKAFGPADKQWRFAFCGPLDNDVTACPGNNWCLEEVAVSDDSQCVSGVTKWQQNTVTLINYFANFNSTQREDLGIKSLVIQVTSNDAPDAFDCPNDLSIIHYVIICDPTIETYVVRGTYEDLAYCVWNFSLHSKFGCVTPTDIPSPSPSGGSSSSKLSGGTIFIIVVIVMVLTYLILGCAYNSFYHGRVGFDAAPNKRMWAQFARYTKAGCVTTKDVLCCTSRTNYAEL